MPPIHILLAIAAAAVMGGNFVASKIALQQFGPYLFNAVRFALVAVLLAPFLRAPFALPWRDRLPWAVLFVLNFSLGTAALAQGLNIATTILTLQLSVPVACLISAFWQGDRLGPWRTLGLAIAFSGLAVVAGTPSVAAHPTGFALALLCAIAGGVFTAGIRPLDVPTFPFLAWMSLLSVPILLFLSFLGEPYPPVAFTHPHADAWIALGYTVLLNTLFAHGAWYFLLRHNKVSEVAPFSLLAPVFGIAMAQARFAEALAPATWLGGALTLFGVAIITLRRPRLIAPQE